MIPRCCPKQKTNIGQKNATFIAPIKGKMHPMSYEIASSQSLYNVYTEQ